MAVRSYAQAIVSTKLADEKLRTWANAATLVRTIIGLFRLEWVLLDYCFSNQSLRWPIFSPNCSYATGRIYGWLNWSEPGFLNPGIVTNLPLAAGSIWAVAPILMAVYGIKLYSAVRRCRPPQSER